MSCLARLEFDWLRIWQTKRTGESANAKYQSNPAFAEEDLIFVGLIGLIDPPKAGVKEAIETCQNAGIQVIMITGDHVETATAIAKQLGIFKADVSGMVKKSENTNNTRI